MVSTRSSDSAAAGKKHDTEHVVSPYREAKRAKTEKDTKSQGRGTDTTSKGEHSSSKATATIKSEHQSHDQQNGEDKTKRQPEETKAEIKEEATSPAAAVAATAEIPHADPSVPSTILEKGIIYFFFRPRVNTPHPEEVSDVARTHMILRPLTSGPDAGLRGDGDRKDDDDGDDDDDDDNSSKDSHDAAAQNTRLLALPKKVLPQSGRDRFLVFVEKSNATLDEIKTEFLRSSEHATKTQGTSVTPAAVPAAEGVYVITATGGGRESHLAYVLTQPRELGEVQRDLGLKGRGSFILSTRNPEFEAPRGVRVPGGDKEPKFSKDIHNEFRGRRWIPSQPAHLDVANAQLLFIGESSGVEKALEPRKKDLDEGKELPGEVLEELEDEDLGRMRGLAEAVGGDSGAIFRDLEAGVAGHPKLMTTF